MKFSAFFNDDKDCKAKKAACPKTEEAAEAAEAVETELIEEPETDDTESALLGAVGALLPPVGWLIALICTLTRKPQKAKSALLGSGVGLLVSLAVCLLVYLFGGLEITVGEDDSCPD